MFKLTTDKQRVIHRLKICSGHLLSTQKLIELDGECLEISHQLRAVESAIREVELLLIHRYLLKQFSPELLEDAIRKVSSSSLHLPMSNIHLY